MIGVPVAKGPADLGRDPPLLRSIFERPGYGAWDIEILAEINNVPRLQREDIRREAERLRVWRRRDRHRMPPGSRSRSLATLFESSLAQDAGGVDTFDVDEIRTAVRAGASRPQRESVQRRHREGAVVKSRQVGSRSRSRGPIETLEPTIGQLDSWGVSYLVDPILEPIGMGFMASLERYANASSPLARRRDADGHREPDRADRCRLDWRERRAHRDLPGTSDSRRSDHRGHSLGARAMAKSTWRDG